MINAMYKFSWKSKDARKVRNSKSYKKARTKAEDYFKSPDKINDLLNDARKKANKKKGPLNDIWDKLLTCFRLLRSYADGSYRAIPWQSLVMILASVIYFVMPLDLIPDFLVGIGYVDDASLLAWTIHSFSSDIDKFAEWESKQAA